MDSSRWMSAVAIAEQVRSGQRRVIDVVDEAIARIESENPVTLQPAWTLGEDAPTRTGMYAAPFSFTGQPAVVVPGSWTRDGRPVGVQLVGRTGTDELLLDLALELQQRLGWLERRPPPAPK